jgi:hypothetical protein
VEGEQIMISSAEIVAYLVAGSTVLGGSGVLINDRRKGKHSTADHQRLYIEDQQQDITNLRRDLALLWDEVTQLRDWAVRAIIKAGESRVQLDPLPSRPPNTTTTEK